MNPEELEKYSYYLAAGASAAQAADMARGIMTGKGQSWLPNNLASSAKGIPNASTASWWKSGKLPFGLRGTFMGAAPTAGATLGLAGLAGTAGFMGANAFMDTNFADSVGLGRNDFKGYGSSLFNLINPTADTNYNTGQTSAFNRSNINVEDYSTTQQRVQAERAAQAQAAAKAQAQTQTQAQPQQSNLPAMNTPSNITKFGPNRSTVIKGGRGGRGNVAARKKAASAPVFKSYGPPNMQRF